MVIDVVGVDEDVSTFSRQKLSCSVGEESCHGELVRLFRFFSRGLGVDALVGGKYHGLTFRNASGSSRDTRERTQRCDGSPGFDVHSILGSAGSGPGRKIVDIVENKDGVWKPIARSIDHLREALRQVDQFSVGASCILWVSILIQVEALEAHLLNALLKVSDEVCKPFPGGRVNNLKETTQFIGSPIALHECGILPLVPLFISDAIDSGVSE